MRFEKPPLIELIAELHWGSPATVIPLAIAQAPGAPPSSIASRHEELFMRFGAKIAGDGYSTFERIIPPGFPVMPLQPVYRYRKSPPEAGGSLFQMGPGLFTANITPPYETWEAFRPVVERGVTLLLESRDSSEREDPFTAVMLRYIDAFRPWLTEGRTPLVFVTEVLGFKIALPPVICDLANTEQPVRSALQFGVPLKNGLAMNLNVSDGTADNEPAIIMDTNVVNPQPIAADVASVMRAFDEAHDVIRASFLGMTENIAKLMQPA